MGRLPEGRWRYRDKGRTRGLPSPEKKCGTAEEHLLISREGEMSLLTDAFRDICVSALTVGEEAVGSFVWELQNIARLTGTGKN